MWKMWKLTKKMVPANLRQKKCTAKWTHGSSKQHFRPLPWCSWTTVMLASHGHPSHKPVAFDALWCTRPLLKKNPKLFAYAETERKSIHVQRPFFNGTCLLGLVMISFGVAEGLVDHLRQWTKQNLEHTCRRILLHFCCEMMGLIHIDTKSSGQ